MRAERIDHWIKMRRSLARFSGPGVSLRYPSQADSITTTPGFKVFGTHRQLTEAVAAAPVNPASDRSRGGGPAGHISLPEPPYLDRQRQQIPRTSTSYFLHGHR